MLWKILSFVIGLALVGVVLNLAFRIGTMALGFKVMSFVGAVLLIIALIFVVRRIFSAA